jgi:hypothetical protein
LLTSHRPHSPGGLLQTSNQAIWVTCRFKNKVIDLLASSLITRAPVCSLPKLDNYQSNNTHLRTADEEAPENRLDGQIHHRPKRESPGGYLGMLSCRKTHPFMQRGQRWSISYGDTKLRTPNAQKCELMNQALSLFLGTLPPLVGRGYLGHQAQNLLLSHILSLARCRKLVSQNRDPLGRSGRLIMGGCQQRSFLPGHPLRLGSVSPHHYGSRLHSICLLLRLHHLSHVPS